MRGFIDLLTLRASHKSQVLFLFGIISLVYLYNFSVNDIWTPNESFYAEAVREMFESGNFLDIFYNYEPRYNKPPLTYWLMASFAAIFGLNEFALRLPIVLMGIGSIWLTYLLGRSLFNREIGLYAMVMMAFSIQLLALKQYASPEMPLTFFFTLTMYWFVRGFLKNEHKYLYLSYFALGLTVLTKGFPYIIVIGGIIALYILLKGDLRWKRIWHDIRKLKLPLGLLITLLIGLSWIIFMYVKDGNDFWEVYYRETFGRALSKETKGIRPFFYLGVISWSIFPYTFALLYAIYYWIRNRKTAKTILLPFCWLIVMLVIFTVAKGKLPTYMIQAHPAIFLIIAPIIADFNPSNSLKKLLWYASFLLPSFIILIANALIVSQLNMYVGFYAVPVIGLIILAILHRGDHKNASLVAAPFWTIALLLLCFGTVLPRLERFRPYDQIGLVINQELNVSNDVPIYIEGTLIHNIPFYAKRLAIRDATIAEINSIENEGLALVRSENSTTLNSAYEVKWKGMIYDFPSESQFAKFIMACIEAENGNLEKFAEYQLVYKPD